MDSMAKRTDSIDNDSNDYNSSSIDYIDDGDYKSISIVPSPTVLKQIMMLLVKKHIFTFASLR